MRQRSRGFANLLVAIFLPDLYVSLQSLGPLGVHRIWRIWSLWGPVSLAALFLPIFMHSLGDVWHLGSEDLESLQVLGPCYLYAFLR